MKNILVIGSINMDMVINTDRLPHLGETITGYGFAAIPGGKGANQALAVSRLGGKVKMLGCVGDDIYGDRLIENLKANGVGTESIEIVGGSSGIAVITICNGDNHIILDKGANEKFTPQSIDENIDLIKWADIVLFQLEIPQDTILYAAKIAKKSGAKVLLNPAPMQKIDPEIMGLVDAFVPNKHEAEQFLNMKIENKNDTEDAVKKLLNMGIEQVVITLGADGCAYNDNRTIKFQHAVKVDVVDTTAAGDSFIGGFCTALCEDKDVDHSIKFATVVSALTVGKKGAGISIPNRSEVDDLIIHRIT